jgi:mannose-6-phosphate isomerase-like protein (cupin superfamily)
MKVIKRDEVSALDSGQGEIIRELAGLAQATARRLSLAEVTITPSGGSREHYHRQMEEVYYLLQGQARITLGEETRVIGPGDSVVIPVGAPHKIVNVGDTDVVMIVACAPAWHEEDNVFLE